MIFLSTLSLRRATTDTRSTVCSVISISIHALLAESDQHTWKPLLWTTLFLSTLSLRRATDNTHTYRVYCPAFLSTLSLRRATCEMISIERCSFISIHALLAESDVGDVWACRWPDISIHALLAESDIKNPEAVSKYMIFLSTLSLRRATACLLACFVGCFYFYPRSPCGERRQLLLK